jgi:hypothetical protein
MLPAPEPAWELIQRVQLQAQPLIPWVRVPALQEREPELALVHQELVQERAQAVLEQEPVQLELARALALQERALVPEPVQNNKIRLWRLTAILSVNCLFCIY